MTKKNKNIEESTTIEKVSKYKETYCFKSKGITVWVKVDYINDRISLVEPSGPYGKFQPKKYLFAERSFAYMQGWADVLTVMTEAVLDAGKRIKAERERVQKEQEERVTKILYSMKDTF